MLNSARHGKVLLKYAVYYLAEIKIRCQRYAEPAFERAKR